MPDVVMTQCWECGSIQQVGKACGICGVHVIAPIADIEWIYCPKCRRSRPIGCACPGCGQGGDP